MYLARRVIDNRLHYVLCESYDNGGCLTNRDLVQLGPRPEQFITYGGGSSFHIDDRLFDRLGQLGVTASYEEVEQFFLPFLDPYIRAKIDHFRDRAKYRTWRPMPAADKKRVLRQIHTFDRRRIHYLRFGQIDQRRLDNSVTLYRQLLDKSRDELEQLIIAQEQDLSPAEYKRYIFTVFDLQRFFKQSYARSMPHILDQNEVDTFFLEEVCRLDRDKQFWKGLDRQERLPPYLIRYMVMFFDYDFPGSESWNDFARLFSESRRNARRQRGRSMSINDATTVFGVSRAELATMNKKQLTAIYRKKAHKLHPDKGGDHDLFIELTAAYNELLRGRR